jgi:hypothetical protein
LIQRNTCSILPIQILFIGYQETIADSSTDQLLFIIYPMQPQGHVQYITQGHDLALAGLS